MVNQYLGQYLLNNSLLSTEQLQNLLATERSVRPKLGVLAIDAGLMTAAQVEEVHKIQHTMDKKFGEIAISLKYLSNEQLENLLSAQDQRRLSLSQAILDKGYLSLGQLETALERYKQENGLASQLEALHNGDFEGVLRTHLDFSAEGENANILYSYAALVMRAIVRFLGEEPILNRSENPVHGNAISQDIVGNVTISTGLVMDNNVLLEMARRYSGEILHEVDELALDCIAEFLNETNGIYIVNMSEQRVEFDLQPPRVGALSTTERTHRISIVTSCGLIDLFLGIDK